MGMLSKIIGYFRPVRHSKKWNRVHSGTRWDLADRTEHGVKLYEVKSEVYQHQDTGEYAVLDRKDKRSEWFQEDNRREWPERVQKALTRDSIWHVELDNDKLPPMWGAIITKGGSSLWKKSEARTPSKFNRI